MVLYPWVSALQLEQTLRSTSHLEGQGNADTSSVNVARSRPRGEYMSRTFCDVRIVGGRYLSIIASQMASLAIQGTRD